MAVLKYYVQGTADLDTFFTKLNAALDIRAILDEGAAVLFNRMRTRFLAEKDPDNVQWVPSYAAFRRSHLGLGGGTLFNTGKLWRSLQVATEGEFSRSISTDAKSASGFDYPATHNFGLNGFPERRFMGFGDGDVLAMSDVVMHRIRQGLGLVK